MPSKNRLQIVKFNLPPQALAVGEIQLHLNRLRIVVRDPLIAIPRNDFNSGGFVENDRRACVNDVHDLDVGQDA